MTETYSAIGGIFFSLNLYLITSNKTEVFLCRACVRANKYWCDTQVLHSQQESEDRYIYSVFSRMFILPNLFIPDGGE